jgi:hypothetical protein
MAGFRHLEWEFYTSVEMKKSKKAVRKFGFLETDHLVAHVGRLIAMREMHLKMKQVSRYSFHMKWVSRCMLTR